MKKKIFTFVILLVLSIAFICSFRACITRSVQTKAILNTFQLQNDSAKYWRDMFGREHARAQALEGNRSTMNLAYGQLLDSVARLNKIRKKDIEDITWLSTQLEGEKVIPVENVLNAENTHIGFKYQDNWMQLQGSGNIFKNQLQEIRMHYTFTDSIILSRIRRKVSLFQKETFIDVVSANPDVKITGVQSIVIRDRPKPWGIGGQAGFTYDGHHLQPYLGAGLSYNFIRF